MSSRSDDGRTGPRFGSGRGSAPDRPSNRLAAHRVWTPHFSRGCNLLVVSRDDSELIETLTRAPRFIAAQLHTNEAVFYAPLTAEQHLALPHHARRAGSGGSACLTRRLQCRLEQRGLVGIVGRSGVFTVRPAAPPQRTEQQSEHSVSEQPLRSPKGHGSVQG